MFKTVRELAKSFTQLLKASLIYQLNQSPYSIMAVTIEKSIVLFLQASASCDGSVKVWQISDQVSSLI